MPLAAVWLDHLAQRVSPSSEVDAHEQLGEPVEKAVAKVGDSATRKEKAVGQREVEVPGDENRRQLVSRLGSISDHPHCFDNGDQLCGEISQEPVLASREPRRQLLQRVESVAVADEANDVPVDPA